MRTSKARAGHRAGQACHRRWNACGKQLPFGPEVGAVCGKAARTDLRGGRSVMSVPTASSLQPVHLVVAVHKSGSGRLCCKSLFALVIKNSPGCRRDFRVKMWGTSSPDDKLTGDLGNVIESTQIGGRRSDRLTAGKLSPGNFGLLQQYRPGRDIGPTIRSPRRRGR